MNSLQHSKQQNNVSTSVFCPYGAALSIVHFDLEENHSLMQPGVCVVTALSRAGMVLLWSSIAQGYACTCCASHHLHQNQKGTDTPTRDPTELHALTSSGEISSLGASRIYRKSYAWQALETKSRVKGRHIKAERPGVEFFSQGLNDLGSSQSVRGKHTTASVQTMIECID